jgi:hypothetical protein
MGCIGVFPDAGWMWRLSTGESPEQKERRTASPEARQQVSADESVMKKKICFFSFIVAWSPIVWKMTIKWREYHHTRQ